jgi:hypothetical protein
VDKLNSRCGSSESESSSCAMAGGGRGEATEASAAPGAEQLGQMHHHRHSMDASSSINAEHLFGTTAMEGASPAEVKRAMSAAKLAELALIDPKKAKRYVFFVDLFCLFLMKFMCYVLSSFIRMCSSSK